MNRNIQCKKIRIKRFIYFLTCTHYYLIDLKRLQLIILFDIQTAVMNAEILNRIQYFMS